MRDRARLDLLADSYLKHMLLILDVNDRGSNPRDFLDPWWSFTRGDPFINGKEHYSQRTMNNPCACGCDHRARLSKLDFVSVGAKAAIERGVCRDKNKDGRQDMRARHDRLIVEHSVPFAVVVNTLFDRRTEWTMDSLREFLNHHYKRALLTKAEDDLLDESRDGHKLTADMPFGWEVWGDPFARYHDRGIIRAD